MADQRTVRKSGESILLGGIQYQIQDVEGVGGSSVVYRASYEDALNSGALHYVFLKELFPVTTRKTIYRDDSGRICCTPEGEETFNYHKTRFKQGNQVNLKLLERIPASMSGNINSYEAWGTYYSVLSVHGGKNLQTILDENSFSFGLREAAVTMIQILDALEGFHENGFLHLDISPDNVLLLKDHALLIDYNSVWDLKETDDREFTFSIKDGYSAPEVRLQNFQDIGYATDIYSVCAVFFRMLSGRTLSENDVIGNGLKKYRKDGFPVLEEEPESAKFKAFQILARGLHLLPRKRYQSVQELRKEFCELIDRIDRNGVSHSALWECSRGNYRKQAIKNVELLPRRILLNDHMEMTEDDLSEQLRKGKCILLKGTGGMGKTTLLYKIWKDSLQNYSPKKPVVLYLSLREYQTSGESSEYIQNNLIERLNGKTIGGGSIDVKKELLHLMDTQLQGGTGFILLLDGLNEAGKNREKLLLEIEKIGNREGVSILLTDRTDEVKEYALSAFESASLLPLDEDTVKKALADSNISPVDDQELFRLLTNPLMLDLYKKLYVMELEISWEADESVKVSSADELVSMYLDQLCRKQMRTDSGDQALQMNHRYILTHLLPAIAGEMKHKRRTLLKMDEIYAVAEASFKDLHSNYFGKYFPEYMGKSRLMLSGIQSESEWFDFAISETLTEEFGLLVKDTENTYRLVHDNFMDCLAGKEEQNRKAYGRIYGWIRRNPRAVRIVGMLLIVGIVSMGGILLYGQLENSGEVVSYTEEEQTEMNEVKTYLTGNMGTLNIQIKYQREILELASETEVLENDKTAVSNLQDQIEKYLDYLEGQDLDYSPSEDLIVEITNINSDYPAEELLELCEAPAYMDYIGRQALARLSEMLCGENTNFKKAEDRQKIVEAYEAYLNAYVEYTFYKLDYVALYTVPGLMDDFASDFRYVGIIYDYFKNMEDLNGQDLDTIERAMNDAEDLLDDAKRVMASTSFGINWEIEIEED